MKNLNVQGNQSFQRNTSIGQAELGGSQRSWWRGLLLAVGVGCAIALSQVAQRDALKPTLAVDQDAAAAGHLQQADVIEDIIEILKGILGGGSGGGGDSGGSGGTAGGGGTGEGTGSGGTGGSGGSGGSDGTP